MAPVLNRTPLACIAFDDGNGKHLRVYYQDVQGTIKESFYDDGSGWTTRAPGDVVGKGRLNTGISACCWANGTQIRVYFIGENGNIVERMYAGGSSWSDGALTSKGIKPTPSSKIACTRFGNGPDNIRVYYQDTTYKLREMCYRNSSGQWTEGTQDLPIALGGTCMSAASMDNGNLWLYFQDTNLKMVEYIWGNSGKPSKGGFVTNNPYGPGSSISISVCNNPDLQVRVFTIDYNNKLCMTKMVGGWQPTQTLTDSIPVSDCALMSINGKADMRGYYQPMQQQQSRSIISEYGSSDGNNWTLMQKEVPTSQ